MVHWELTIAEEIRTHRDVMRPELSGMRLGLPEIFRRKKHMVASTGLLLCSSGSRVYRRNDLVAHHLEIVSNAVFFSVCPVMLELQVLSAFSSSIAVSPT
eukprot:1612595-Amphidinium_carterae.1